MSLQIVSRVQWGARSPRHRTIGDMVTETYLHHTAGAHQGASSMRAIQNYHMDVRGWSDIAYNFVIDPHDLKVYEGRGWGVRPGAQKSHNTGTWAVCVMGHFNSQHPTQGLLDVIANLISVGADAGHIPRELTGGHRDAPNQNTTCPGDNLHARIHEIRELVKDEMTPEQEAAVDAIVDFVNETDDTAHIYPFVKNLVVKRAYESGSGGLTLKQVFAAIRRRLS